MKFRTLILIFLIAFTFEIRLNKKSEKTYFSMVSEGDAAAAPEGEKKEGDANAAGKEGNNGSNQTESSVTKENIEGWFSIKSASFERTEKFPVLILPSGRQASFKFDFKTRFLRNGFFNKNKKKDENFPKDDNYFWFKTNKNLVYFTPLKNSTQILAAFKVVKNSDITPKNTGYCTEAYVEDEEESFTICSYQKEEMQTLMCSLKKYSGQLLPYSCKEGGLGELKELPTKVTEVVKESVFIIPKAARHCNDGWNYDEQGKNWECICSEGFEQSPIELPTKLEAIHSDVAPVFYFSSSKLIKKVYFSGNALRMDALDFGSITTLNGAKYLSKEIIFHTPAEHIIKGEEKQADMEMEIIYEGSTVGDTNKQVSLSFLFNEVSGKNSRFFAAFDIVNLPNILNPDPVELTSGVTIPYIQYEYDPMEPDKQLKEDFPLKPFSFYTYQGSLSSPPCTERTIRYVASDPIPLSPTIIEFFRDTLNLPGSSGLTQNIQLDNSQSAKGGCNPTFEDGTGDIVEQNTEDTSVKKVSARALQNLNGRQVFYWDMPEHCGIPAKPEEPITGHYESIRREYTQYYYMNNNKPSGLPNSFVIPEDEAYGKTAV